MIRTTRMENPVAVTTTNLERTTRSNDLNHLTLRNLDLHRPI
jgi:hypothetical protein